MTDPTPHEAGPLPPYHVDGSHDETAAANLMRKHREMKRHYASPAIISGQCSSCDAFGSLWYDSGMCQECFSQHEALTQPVILVAKPIQKAPPSSAGPIFRSAVANLIIGMLALTGAGWLIFSVIGPKIGDFCFWLGGKF